MLRGFITATFVALVSCGVASASLTATVELYRNYGTTGGGEFLARPHTFGFAPHSTGLSNGFETFCLEKNEYISLGRTYYVRFNTAADHGGGGSVHGSDPLDARTAYLYSRFVNGTLNGYTYATNDGGAARRASADALQHVIWYLEQEENMAWSLGDNSLADRFYHDALAHAGSSIGAVRVMNMFGDAGATEHAQDQLVLVPSPDSGLLGLLGLGAAAIFRRR